MIYPPPVIVMDGRSGIGHPVLLWSQGTLPHPRQGSGLKGTKTGGMNGTKNGGVKFDPHHQHSRSVGA
jgi:hypothetical protein